MAEESVGTVFRPKFGVSRPDLTGTVKFGSEGAHVDFYMPMMIFSFMDSKGTTTNIGDVYIRMTSSFETTLSNPFQETEGIFGQPGDLTSIGSALSTVGGSALESLKKQFIGGAGNLAGFVASAGSSGKSQVEFLTRQMFNNFQQLIYKGPNFRRFSPAFNMRPTNAAEAKAMKEIIARFKIASSPKSGLGTGDNVFTGGGPDDNDVGQLGVNTNLPAGSQGGPSEEVAKSISISDAENLLSDASFTFGYPDMCKFRIILYKAESGEISTVFESDVCVIENVAVTYGSQNKITFFEGSDTAGYYPTDVVLNLQLREAILQTESNAILEYNTPNLTIL